MPVEALARVPERKPGKEIPRFGQSITVNHDTGWITISKGDQQYNVSLTKPGRFMLDLMARNPGEDFEKNSLKRIVKDAGSEAHQALVLSSTVAHTMLHLRNTLNSHGDTILEIESYKSKKGPSSYMLRVDSATIIKDGEVKTFNEPRGVLTRNLPEDRNGTYAYYDEKLSLVLDDDGNPEAVPVQDTPVIEVIERFREPTQNVIQLSTNIPQQEQTTSRRGHYYTETRAAAEEQPTESTLRVYKGDVDIFVPADKEDAYLQRYGIIFRPLDNGAFIAGATSKVDDQAYASVELTFPSAPIYESHPGVSHMVEHLVAEEPSLAARRYEARHGAWTSLKEMLFRVNGIANPQVPDYGIWPVVPVLLDGLSHPLTTTEAVLDREKRVINAEIVNRGHGLDDDKIRNDYFVERIIHLDGNYLIGAPIGTSEQVNALTLADVYARHGELFIPRGLTAKVFSEGSPEITDKLLALLVERIGEIPDDGRIPPKVPLSVLDTLNPAYRQGELYTKETDRKDGQQDFYLTWAMPSPHLTPLYAADINFMHAIDGKMRTSFRRHGGYSLRSFPNLAKEGHVFHGYRFRFPATEAPEEFIQELYPAIKSEVFESMDADALTDAQSIIQRRSAAAIISLKERFDHAIYGSQTYGRLIDSDKTLHIDRSLSVEDLRAAQERFIAMPPTIFVDK